MSNRKPVSPDKRPQCWSFPKIPKSDPDILLRSVALVYADWEVRDLQPGAEKWQNDTRVWRPILLEEIRNWWMKLSHVDEVFPWSDDYTIEVWVSFRKQKIGEKVFWLNYYNIPIPKRIESKARQEA